MTSALAQARQTASGGGLSELRSRLLFVLMAIVVYRIGVTFRYPASTLNACSYSLARIRRILDLVNMFGGGALERMSIFALGIMPYISSSIITQLLVATTPLQQLRKEGEAGRKKSLNTQDTARLRWRLFKGWR